MDKFDSIVIGGGISGLTVSLLLALNGEKVILVEKAPRLGGSLARFRRKNLPFEVGFHFTGGLEEGGIVREIFESLGVYGLLEPYMFKGDRAMSVSFEREGRTFDIPQGIPRVIDAMSAHFPGEDKSIREYFATLARIRYATPSMDLKSMAQRPPQIDEDFKSLDEALKETISDPVLRGLLGAPATCYGVGPREVSFANHARMVLGFYESLGFVKDGGDAIVRAFQQRLGEAGVEIACGDSIASLADIVDRRVGRFVLSSGREIIATNCVFTNHPKRILEVLPREYFRKGFVERVNSFEESMGFFSVYGSMEVMPQDDEVESALGSVFPHSDIGSLFEPSNAGKPGPMAVKFGEEVILDGKKLRPVNVLESAFPSETKEWEHTTTGNRPPEYYRYKEDRVGRIMERLRRSRPEYASRIEVLDSGSLLTNRDYLNNDGGAYGIRQKMGQHNMIGQLALRNLYVAGQSAVLPGLMGAMISSFIVGGSVLGRDRYNEFVERAKTSAHA